MNKLLFALVLLASQGAAADTLPGRVVGIADGDTLTVLDQTHERHKVRLSGIDAPEKSQPFGQRSKQSLSDLAYGRAVSVEWRKRDRFKRIVGKVFEGGQDVNLEQVRRGLAWHYKHYQGEQDAVDRAYYADAEIEARAAQRGLWALPKAQRVPPWEWRNGGKQSAQAAPTERTAVAGGPKRSQQRDRDGNWWVSLPLRGSQKDQARNFLIKSWYITGIIEGVGGVADDLVMQVAVEALDESAAEKARADYRRTLDRYVAKVTPAQISDGLDAFYSDFRNRGILVALATGIVLRQIAGVPQTSIERMVEVLRQNAAR